MSDFFGSIWWLLVSIGVLVTFHEYGHFCVARFFGVHVLRFSVGFGRPLLKRIGRDGTEYVIAAIPLGGYVKMLDEREFHVDPADRLRAFNNQPVLQRMAIAAAGPAFNFLLCFALLWAMFVIGKPDYLPIVGRADALAAQAGFQPDDRLLSIDGKYVPTWSHAAMLLAGAAMDRRPVEVEIAREDGGHAIRTLPLQQLGDKVDEAEALAAIGLVPRQFLLPAVIGKLEADGPSDRLKVGDRILAVNGVKVFGFDQLARTVHAQARSGQPLHLELQRGSQHMLVDVLPKMRRFEDGSTSLSIGIRPQEYDAPYDSLRRYGPIDALGVSAHEMWRLTSESAGMMWRMVSQGATRSISGPVAIARYANESAQQGLAWFLFFLAILSLSLGMLNLLPIPILDGGHLLYYLIELVKGSPVSERTLVVGQYIGLAMLGGLMCLAFYNDLLRPLY
jgi:regulator of sigma E protease